MKIVIVSDSHGNREILEKIVLQNPSANIFLHAGDSGLCKLEISPYVSVKGNCDYESDFPDKLIIKTPYGNLYMTHGNRLYEINSQNSEISTTDNRPEMGEQMGQPGGGDNSSSVTKTGATEFTSDVTEFSL